MDKKFRIREGIDRRELFGNLDVNLDYIREVTSADIIQRDDELIIKAESEEAIDKASRILDELMSAIDAGEVLDKQKVQYIISLSEEGISYKESRVNKDVICFTHKGKPLKPKTKVIEELGWPVLSKEIAGKISLLQNPTPKNATVRHAIITGETGEYGGFQKNSRMKLSQRWLEKFGGADAEGAALGYEAAPFKVSERCCYYLKEKPCDDWAKEHNSVPYLGLMASEGGRREKSLMMHGCNYYGKSTIRSAPFAIFSRQDILQLALDLNVPIPAEYGEIVRDKDGTLRTTLAQRTGCTMCGFGIQLEQRPNRFDRLRSANPKEWEFWMRHVCRDENGDWYGWGRVLDYIGVEWENEPGQLPGQMSIEDYQT